MADIKKVPGVPVTNNHYGFIKFGPHDKDDTASFTLSAKGGYNHTVVETGNSTVTVSGKSEDICGKDFTPQYGDGEIPKECPAKVIVAKNGDIHLIAEAGYIRLKAKGIFIESSGSGDKWQGNINVSANGPITIATNDKVSLGGVKICLRGQAAVDVVTQGTLKLLGDMSQQASFSILSIFNPAVGLESLIQSLLSSCK